MSRSPLLFFFLVFVAVGSSAQAQPKITPANLSDPAFVFKNPPEAAKPGVLWMWMGSNVSEQGITNDLLALKQEGFSSATMSNLADVTVPWGAVIKKSPTPQIIGWTEPWWKMVRFAAEEAQRLDIKLGIFNCPGYEATGGPWITPELSMQEVCWSSLIVKGSHHVNAQLLRPSVNPHANMRFPVFNLLKDTVEDPISLPRSAYYKDISVLAMPATGIVNKDSIIDISDKMDLNGRLRWDAPPGNWIVYRFGHTTTGGLIQPAQPQAMGLECDKMSVRAVSYHMDHIIGEIKKHLGSLAGTVVTDVYFDSYEIDDVSWTPNMKEEFKNRKGYDITPFLAQFAGRCVGSKADSMKFSIDFDNTERDLMRDVYFTTIAKKLKEAHLNFLSEPYGGPWRPDDVMPLVDHPMCEFWTEHGVYTPYETEPTLAAIRKTGNNLIQAEAFTGQPADSKWDEYPAWLKPIGDAALCLGVNRMIFHRFVHQPWDAKYLPGNSMGQWGTHFDRTQTWWKPGKAMITYLQRCQALLQWGRFVPPDSDFSATHITDSVIVKHIHRNLAGTHIFFVANTSRYPGSAQCSFGVSGMQPEIWDPVTGDMRDLQQFEDNGKQISLAIKFDDAQSYFIVFRHKKRALRSKRGDNFPESRNVNDITGTWKVQFDPKWGGPANPVSLDSLTDWTKSATNGIKYYSGTATYRIAFNLKKGQNDGKPFYIELGLVKHIARVKLNDRDLGVVWTAPWHIKIPAGVLKKTGNKLEVEVTNVWANRLIGDEQEPDDCEWLPNQYFYYSGKYLKQFPNWFLKNQPRPSKGRYCFTTWNYFSKNSPLVSSGLMGPVSIVQQK